MTRNSTKVIEMVLCIASIYCEVELSSLFSQAKYDALLSGTQLIESKYVPCLHTIVHLLHSTYNSSTSMYLHFPGPSFLLSCLLPPPPSVSSPLLSFPLFLLPPFSLLLSSCFPFSLLPSSYLPLSSLSYPSVSPFPLSFSFPSLHRNLIEHLNAEIVLHTITDVSIALEWLRSTFLYIRVTQNPKHYGRHHL